MHPKNKTGLLLEDQVCNVLVLVSPNEMVGWHHQLDIHEFEQVPEVGDGQGSLAYCIPWGHKELDMTSN